MIKMPKSLWIVVADGAKALFVQNVSDTIDPDLRVMRVDEIDIPNTAKLGTEQPGRRDGPAGAGRSAIEPTDWHRLAKEEFASTIAALLNKWAQAGGITDLVIVAPPQTLGELRAALSPKVTGVVRAEMAKDLTNHTLPDIAKLVMAEMADI
ncbi:Protein required for attachment to host cells [Thalassovita gelatinovora]|uniref:Protein required for attachment to host cells n=1 Tax=Thalassovita gelatinovora TaxID=53501 RepID=A0A0N7LUK0_THAGE|nr:host attachment family protein [Thalassovita gelatinovora]QIZ79218.1 host attachment protein [Thalassovita gelatinovora]CUH63714.1 Protein required for attachment to host cells [Thalassovita gelatinovora]SER02209.1 Protein required for attachment to host cells [Thalassovita gelatinovora]